jgi:hypothetical protein
MRPRAPLLALLLGCARGPAPALPDDDREAEVRAEGRPMSDDDAQRLTALAAAGGALHWRLPGAGGPRCEAWQFAPDADDPTRGRLVHAAAGGDRYQFTYVLADGHLRLTAPTRERDIPGQVGAVTLALSLPCVFAGMSLTPADESAARRVVLAANERWFLDADACAAAPPPAEPLQPAPGELHPLGCVSALADPGTRALPDRPPPPGPAAARLRASKRLWWLRRRGGAVVCEAWQHAPADGDPRHGALVRQDRDERGRRARSYGYALSGAAVTLLGPSEFRGLDDVGGPAELARTRGCLRTRPLALRGELLLVGDDPWFLRRRDCERARRAGAPARPDLDCAPT